MSDLYRLVGKYVMLKIGAGRRSRWAAGRLRCSGVARDWFYIDGDKKYAFRSDEVNVYGDRLRFKRRVK